MTYLLDTNVVSELVRPGADARVLAWIATVPEDSTFISTITIAELHKGIHAMAEGKRKGALDRWLRLSLLPRYEQRMLGVTLAVADTWGRFAAHARRARGHFHALDGFVAATAFTHRLVVVTRNTKDFTAFDVPLLNPWDFAN